MKRIYLALARLAVWLDSERLSIGIAAFYGTFIWVCHSLSGNSAFSAYSVPEPVFAMPLLLGAALQAWGLRRGLSLCLMLGALSGFGVFLSALISCCIVAPTSTGVPVYLGLSAFYLVLALHRATGREYGFGP